MRRDDESFLADFDRIGEMTRAELVEFKGVVMGRLASINDQIDKAESAVGAGLPVDADWLRRLRSAKRLHGCADQKVGVQLASLRLREKEARKANRDAKNESDAREFLCAARLVLDKATYLRVWDAVYAMRGQEAR